MVLPHKPFVTTPDDLKASTKLEKHKAMVLYMDGILGRFLDKLSTLGIRDKTLVFWTTDNGTSGQITGTLDGRPVTGGKGKTTEPGICVPFLVSAPGLVPQGVATDALTDITDILPTFLQLAGGQLEEDYIYDGHSIADLILGRAHDSPRSWILSMGGGNEAKLTDKGVENRYHFRDRVLREKRFKLYVNTERKPVKLVDVVLDPAEERNLIHNPEPEARAALTRLSMLVPGFPHHDNDPIYDPLPAQPWDVPVSAKSGDWKE
jgi:arylsulfatase A-like enzyme